MHGGWLLTARSPVRAGLAHDWTAVPIDSLASACRRFTLSVIERTCILDVAAADTVGSRRRRASCEARGFNW